MNNGQSLASADTTTKKLSKDAINILPLFYYSGPVTLVRTPEELDVAVERLREEPVLGFDTETRPSFVKGKSYSPSLVQLAARDEIFLFQLKWQPLGEALADILSDASIVKTGVAVHDDMHFLEKIHPFTPASVIDLAEVARKNNIENQSLRALAACFLGVRISKGEQCSNWASKELTARQVRYAATDAWASLAIYERMRELKLVPHAQAR